MSFLTHASHISGHDCQIQDSNSTEALHATRKNCQKTLKLFLIKENSLKCHKKANFSMPGRGNTEENNCARNVGKGIDL